LANQKYPDDELNESAGLGHDAKNSGPPIPKRSFLSKSLKQLPMRWGQRRRRIMLVQQDKTPLPVRPDLNKKVLYIDTSKAVSPNGNSKYICCRLFLGCIIFLFYFKF